LARAAARWRRAALRIGAGLFGVASGLDARAAHLQPNLVHHSAVLRQRQPMAAGPGVPGELPAQADGFAVHAPLQGLGRALGAQHQTLARGRDVGVQRDDGARHRLRDACPGSLALRIL